MIRMKYLLIVPIVLFLSGCMMDLLEVDLQKGSLISGEKRLKIHEWSDGDKKIISSSLLSGRRSPYGFYAYDGSNEIAIELSAIHRARLYVATKMINRKPANIVIEPSSYSFNGETTGALTLQTPYPKGAIGYVKSGYILKMYEIGLPKELVSHGIRINGDGVRNIESFIDKLGDERYRYIINFKIDEHPYQLDVEFQYESYRKFHIGIPGTP